MTRDEKTEIRRAMWSVYTHSYFGAPGPRAQPLVRAGEIPLDDAVGVLLGSSDGLAHARRMRALRRLISGGFLHDKGEPGAFLEHTEKLAFSVGLQREEVARLEALEPWEAARALAGFAGALNLACAASDATCVACYHPLENWTRIRATARFALDRETVARHLDPRCWGICSESFWTHTVDPGNWSTALPIPQDIGEPWSAPLYELAVFSDEITQFENILQIYYRPEGLGRPAAPPAWIEEALDGPRDHHPPELPYPDDFELILVYGLLMSQSAKVFGQATGAGTLKRDFGRIWVKDLGAAGCEVVMEKTLQFDTIPGAVVTIGTYTIDYREALNYLAPIVMCAWLEEVTQQLPCCSCEEE